MEWKNEFENKKIESLVFVIFEICEFRNIGRSTFACSKY